MNIFIETYGWAIGAYCTIFVEFWRKCIRNMHKQKSTLAQRGY